MCSPPLPSPAELCSEIDQYLICKVIDPLGSQYQAVFRCLCVLFLAVLADGRKHSPLTSHLLYLFITFIDSGWLVDSGNGRLLFTLPFPTVSDPIPINDCFGREQFRLWST